MIKTNYLFAIVICLLVSGISIAQTRPEFGASKTSLSFLEDISIEPAATPAFQPAATVKAEPVFAARKQSNFSAIPLIEKASRLQFKYAMLLDMEVEMIRNLNLFSLIDEWYGVKYKFGGISKAGIDCSALMQIFFTALYGVALPRTAKDQFDFCRRITRPELQEGDLVFFNTRGGVSHVGMYLANNKFLHASTSGVMVSDLEEEYYSRRLIGMGRIDDVASMMSFYSSPQP